MTCKCTDKKQHKDFFEVDKKQHKDFFGAIAKAKTKDKRLENKNLTESFMKTYVNHRIEKITELLDDITPFLGNVSEEDKLCSECCYKHLAQACAYFEESKTKQYTFNIFRCVGQMGLAENHVRDNKTLQEAIRTERLKLQRGGGEPNWGLLLEGMAKIILQEGLI